MGIASIVLVARENKSAYFTQIIVDSTLAVAIKGYNYIGTVSDSLSR